MRGAVNEYQAMLLRVIAVKYDITTDEAIAILFKALKDEKLRNEIRQIIYSIEKRNNKVVRIWLGEGQSYKVVRKIGKTYSKPVWYIIDILINSITHNKNIFYENFRLVNIVLQ